ncbi:MAG TPA: DNA topoisomerase I [Candidatus Omnitrophota bacterium]|nr:DNA topoisomerase I [Candidatus Omnitrophota bacterium]
MPKKRKIPKSQGELSAENYFPVSEENLKHAIEKTYKKPEIVVPIIEKQGSIAKEKVKRGRRKAVNSSRNQTPRRPPREKGNIRQFETKNINLKQDGYELIITEKPQAAEKIANALGKSARRNIHGVYYHEVDRKGNKIVVACAVGHLFTLSQKERNSGTPVFDLQWVPNYLARKNDFTKKYYDTILSLVKNAGAITIATDYDIEGEVIGMNVVRYLCGQKDAGRMKFSTLTPAELNISYEHKLNHLDWGQAIAGETRHYLDWLYGINLSRALMDAIKSTGRFKIMSIGRVQGPTLNIIVEKERKISEFKSQKYWQVFITAEKGNEKIELEYEKDIFNKAELDKFDNLKGKNILLNTEKSSQFLPPNPPFNLTALQTESYRLYGLTPSRTLQIAQSLYLSGLISYPRTSSQKLPPSIAYEEILRKIAKRFNAEKLIARKNPVEGKKSDPAHPSIYPTGENAERELSSEEMKVYELIARRFISLFCDDAIIDKKVIKGEVQGLKFSARGSSVKKKGWLDIYPIKMEDKNIPDANGEFKIMKIRNEEKETQPPKRYSPASIVSELEKRNLGTKATRAAILETLYDRGYIQNQSIQATPFGISLIETMEKYSPVIIDENLTRQFEKEMETIQQSHSGFEDKEKRIIDEAKGAITSILGQFGNNRLKIGNELLNANKSWIEEQKRMNIITKCPKCGEGSIAIMYSKKTRRYFAACNKYPDCKNTYSLPPNGLIKKTDKFCEACNWPMLMRLSKGKKPWIFCFNPDCETNRKRVEEYREKKEREGGNPQPNL